MKDRHTDTHRHTNETVSRSAPEFSAQTRTDTRMKLFPCQLQSSVLDLEAEKTVAL